MACYTRWSVLLLLVIFLPAGCPVSSPGTTSDPLDSGGTTVAGDGSGDIGGDTGHTADDLEVQFPGCTEPEDGYSWRAEVLSLVNRERSQRGLATLVLNDTLTDQADQYACEMIYYGFFDHVNPITGTELPDRAAEFGYEYYTIGENLAAGQRSPIEAMQSWMNSTGHRDNILSPIFTEIGIGVRAGGTYGYYWVQEFGLPQ
ncbi:MAG: CAP domain-containing protein [Planctomycetota bacterium]